MTVRVMSMRKNILILLLMMIVIPLAGELKFYPFGSSFRISFCVPIFFLLLMWLRRIPLLAAGFGVGVSVVLFRLSLAAFTQSDFRGFQELIVLMPALFYYLTYSWLFSVTNLSRLNHPPFVIGLLSVFIETTSSLVELAYRYLTLGEPLTLPMMSQILIIAIIRSFFALSFYFIIKLREAEVMSEQKSAQNEQMLLLISNLYQESIHLKKTLQQAEDITRNCYSLYRTLKESPAEDLKQDDLARDVLAMAGQIHEIKKDNQKIHAGLSKLIYDENPTDYMPVSEIGKLILATNQKYAQHLGKKIKFTLEEPKEYLEDLPPLHVFTVLSLVNNLVANAVEAIPDTGCIRLALQWEPNAVSFTVYDTGTGITAKYRDLIFEPGYTSKYDAAGNPSTGIGLTYVREVVEQLQGSVDFYSHPPKGETAFMLNLPLTPLIKPFIPAGSEVTI